MKIEILDHVDEINDAVIRAARRALFECGSTAVGYAKKLCPVDTGNLREHISSEIDLEDLTAYIGTNVEYAPYVEYGTRGYGKRADIPPRHFLKDAMDQHKDLYLEIIRKELQDAVDGGGDNTGDA